MTPLKRYQQDIAEHGFQRDEAQYNAVVALDNLYHAIAEFQSAPIPQLSTWQKLLGKKPELPEPPKGLYFWGGVGRGKTYLMDAFLTRCLQNERCECIFTALCIESMMNSSG